MQKFLDYLRNKSIGYYIVAGITLLAIIVGIVFFATYNNPAFNGPENTPPMGNKADGLAIETIGLFLFVGAAVEIVVLLLPQYRFIQIGAIVMFGLAFMKDIILFADFIVGKINGVEYNGGNFGLNLFIFITITLIVISAVVAAFFGFFKKEDDSKAAMKPDTKNVISLAKLGGGAALLVAAILVASLVSTNLTKSHGSNKANNSGTASSAIQNSDSEPEPEPEYFDPITEDIKATAEAYDYDFNPEEVILEEQDEYDLNDATMKGVPTQNGNRDGHYLVYVFEGAYAEGYQGDYSETYGSIYLWEDGLYGGRINSTDIRGYWYNSSKNAPADDPETPENEALDCLDLVGYVDRYEFINFERASGFYDWRAHIYLGFSWGTRSMEIAGYMYYPEVAIAIDPSSTGLEFKVGDTFDRDGWVADRILKNLNYSAVFKASEVTWTDPTGLKNGQQITDAGEYEVKAKWNGFEASVTVKVTE